mmetsp:Transcript_5956/g.13191  ORF Transcript_5956/g.13191 Transcript_5956/m.13191 type:complete len:114 (+) Transcript_5956:653-994(+)
MRAGIAVVRAGDTRSTRNRAVGCCAGVTTAGGGAGGGGGGEEGVPDPGDADRHRCTVLCKPSEAGEGGSCLGGPCHRRRLPPEGGDTEAPEGEFDYAAFAANRLSFFLLAHQQ